MLAGRWVQDAAADTRIGLHFEQGDNDVSGQRATEEYFKCFENGPRGTNAHNRQ